MTYKLTFTHIIPTKYKIIIIKKILHQNIFCIVVWIWFIPVRLHHSFVFSARTGCFQCRPAAEVEHSPSPIASWAHVVAGAEIWKVLVRTDIWSSIVNAGDDRGLSCQGDANGYVVFSGSPLPAWWWIIKFYSFFPSTICDEKLFCVRQPHAC